MLAGRAGVACLLAIAAVTTSFVSALQEDQSGRDDGPSFYNWQWSKVETPASPVPRMWAASASVPKPVMPGPGGNPEETGIHFVHGGLTSDNTTVDDLWAFAVDASKLHPAGRWQQLHASFDDGIQRNSTFGHSMLTFPMHDKQEIVMYLFGGANFVPATNVTNTTTETYMQLRVEPYQLWKVHVDGHRRARIRLVDDESHGKPGTRPAGRYGHVLVSRFYSEKDFSSAAYLWGGTLADGTMARDMWKLSIGEHDAPVWQQLHVQGKNHPQPRTFAAGVLLAGRLLVYGGRGEAGLSVPDVDTYEIEHNKWTKSQRLVGFRERQGSVLQELDGYLVAFGGQYCVQPESMQHHGLLPCHGPSYNDVLRFDPDKGKDSEKELDPWDDTAPANRMGSTWFYSQRSIFVFGGGAYPVVGTDLTLHADTWAFHVSACERATICDHCISDDKCSWCIDASHTGKCHPGAALAHQDVCKHDDVYEGGCPVPTPGSGLGPGTIVFLILLTIAFVIGGAYIATLFVRPGFMAKLMPGNRSASAQSLLADEDGDGAGQYHAMPEDGGTGGSSYHSTGTL